MRLKKFININESIDLSETALIDLEKYLRDNYGSSVTSLGMGAADMQHICLDLDIEDSDEFLTNFPFPNNRLKSLAEKFFSKDDLFYGQDEEEYYEDDDYVGGEIDDDYAEESDELLNGVAMMVHKFFDESGVENFYVSNKSNTISLQFILNRKEKFKKLIKIVGLVKKLKTDILIQYDIEMDLWETKRGEPLLTFDFYYNTDKKGQYDRDELPF